MSLNDDLKTFNLTYSEYRNRFIRFAHSYVKDIPVAEDIVADAFMQYWEKRGQVDSDVPAYVFTAVKNKCLNHLRHVRIKETVLEAMRNHAEWLLQTRISTLEACDPEELFSNEVRKTVHCALKSLPETTRRFFILNRFHDKSYREIAEQHNMSVKNVEYHISKALKTLKKELKQ